MCAFCMAAAPPRRVMNSRRVIPFASSMVSETRAGYQLSTVIAWPGPWCYLCLRPRRRRSSNCPVPAVTPTNHRPCSSSYCCSRRRYVLQRMRGGFGGNSHLALVVPFHMSCGRSAILSARFIARWAGSDSARRISTHGIADIEDNGPRITDGIGAGTSDM
jgi:hypothetical protein